MPEKNSNERKQTKSGKYARNNFSSKEKPVVDGGTRSSNHKKAVVAADSSADAKNPSNEKSGSDDPEKLDENQPLSPTFSAGDSRMAISDLKKRSRDVVDDPSAGSDARKGPGRHEAKTSFGKTRNSNYSRFFDFSANC